MYYILLGAAMLGCIKLWSATNRKIFGDVISPFNLLLFAWIGPLFIRGFGLSDRAQPWTLQMYLILLWVTLCLTATSLMARRLLLGSRIATQKKVFEAVIAIFRDRIFLNLLLLFFAISFSAYIYNEFITNPVGIPVLAYLRDPTTNLHAINRWGKEGDSRTMWGYFAMPIQVLVPMLYLAFRANSRRKVFFALAILFPLMAALKLSRVDILFSLISFAAVEYYYRLYIYGQWARLGVKVARYVKYALLAVALVFFLDAFLIVRSGYSSDDTRLARISGMNIDAGNLTGPITEIYGYFAMPFDNLFNFYDSYRGEYVLGVGPLRPLLSLVGQAKLANEMMQRLELDYILLPPINTYTFLMLIYAELGVPGLIIVPPIYGALISLLYARFRRRPNFVNLFIYLTFLPCWIWLFATNGFSVLSVYLNGAFVLGFYEMYRILSRSRRQAQLQFSGQPGQKSGTGTSLEVAKRFSGTLPHRR